MPAFVLTSNEMICICHRKVLRISSTTGQMRLRCRRISTEPVEEKTKIKIEKDEDSIEEVGDTVIRERAGKRRMAVQVC